MMKKKCVAFMVRLLGRTEEFCYIMINYNRKSFAVHFIHVKLFET